MTTPTRDRWADLYDAAMKASQGPRSYEPEDRTIWHEDGTSMAVFPSWSKHDGPFFAACQPSEILSLISAARDVDAAPQWHTIDSAPKDGSPVLLLSKETRRAAIGRWNPDGDSWVDQWGNINGEIAHHLEVTGIWEASGGWFQPNEVTHWMPLAAPPPSDTPPIRAQLQPKEEG